MDNAEQLRSWLHALLGHFAGLGESDRQALSGTLEDISAPCQVDAVWFAAPDVNVGCQVFVFSRFADMEHGLMTVHGPAHPFEAGEILNTLASHPRWQRAITGRPIFALRNPSYPRLLEVPIHQALAHIKQVVLTRTFGQPAQPSSPAIWSAGRLTDDAFYWICAGNLAERSPQDMAKDILEKARGRALSAKRTTQRPAQVEAVKQPGFGTYLYPPIWIGELPTESAAQRLRRVIQEPFPGPIGPSAEEAVSTVYRGVPTVFRQDGFAAIKEANRAQALRQLNELIVAFLLSGLPSYAVRDHELADVDFQDDNRIARTREPITSTRMAWGTGTMTMFERSPESLEWTRTALSTDDIRRVLSTAGQLSSVHTPSLLFFLESYTAFQDSQLPQSYIMSWAVIEDWIVAKWEAFLKAGGRVSGKRLKKLTESHLAWTVDHYLETLNLVGEVDNERYKSLMSLKSKRNSLLHDRKIPSTEDAAAALQTAENLLRELLPVEIEPFLAAGRLPGTKVFTATMRL